MATVCQTSPLSASLQHQLRGYICALENPYLTTKPSPQQRLNTQLYGEARGNFGLAAHRRNACCSKNAHISAVASTSSRAHVCPSPSMRTSRTSAPSSQP